MVTLTTYIFFKIPTRGGFHVWSRDPKYIKTRGRDPKYIKTRGRDPKYIKTLLRWYGNGGALVQDL